MKARKRKTYPLSHKKPEVVTEVKKSKEGETSELKDEKVNLYVPITKTNDEKRIVVGVVLEPETVDAQGDIIPRDVIEKAAHQFLSGYNVRNTLGFVHKVFKKNFDPLESYVVPQDMTIGSQAVKAGSWVMSVKVLNKDIWQLVKDGQIKEFSIGGKAKSQQLD